MKLFKENTSVEGDLISVMQMSDNCIRLCVIEVGVEKTAIQYMADLPIPEDVVRGGELLSPKYISDIIEKVRSSGVDLQKLHLIIPSKKVQLLSIHDIDDNAADARSAVETFLMNRKMDPYKYVAYCKHEPSQNASYFSIMLREYHSSLYTFFNSIGIQILSIKTPIQALGMHFHDKRTLGFINIGSAYSEIGILHDGHPIIISNLKTGVNEYIEIIKKELKIDETEARKIYDQYGFSAIHPDKGLYKKLLVAIRHHINELSVHISSWTNTPQYKKSGKAIDGVIVSGPFSYTPGLVQLLTRTFHMPVYLINVRNSPHAELIECGTLTKKQITHFLPVLGLAFSLIDE